MATRKPGTQAKAAGDPSPAPDAPPGASATTNYTYQQKYTRCNKPGCRRCAEGPGHGPYWYAFWWEGGRTRARYLGKTLPPDAGPTPASAELPPSATPILDRPDITAPAAAHLPAPAFRVVTLGRFALWRDGAELPETVWVRRKALSLFKLLLSVTDHRLQREQVLDLLWPDEDPQVAAVALRGATHAVRRVLGGASDDTLLVTSGGAFALGVGPGFLIDADAFAAAARAALAGTDIAACRAALALSTGEYLPGDLYEDWAVRRRDELAALRLSLLLHQARICGEHGDLAEARDALAAILAIDPAHEEAASRQMTLLAAMGEQSEALRVYSRLRAVLREQYDAEPGEEVAGLARRLRAQLAARTTHRPLPDQPPRLGNLPAAQSTFVGRRDAQDAVRVLLGEGRLVTLTGSGGSGKTRLALQVAATVQHDYPDGVWLCELAGLAPAAAGATSPDPVAGAVAGALGVHEEPGCSLAETLGAFLEPRRLLLVLDNCEHLLDPAAQLAATLLARCPALTVLATSQEALGIGGEAVWTVPPLALPDPAERTTPESIESYDAIRLFVERARARRPGFALDPATAPLVLEICHKLDGIPLALELAAARLAFLSLADLAARLDDRFRLLIGGSRVALPRQQTLRATMDWSYNLLGEHERILLQRLTVFAGGWTLPAAEGACADDDLPGESILDTLGGLVAKSLVTVHGEGESLRYGMLETVRQYGRARLAEGGEERTLQERHLAWFADHGESAIAAWSSADQAALLRRLDAELENIRAALNWGLAGGDAVTALRLASALSRYWTTRGLGSEGRRWTARALEAAPQAPAELRATALNRCAILAREEGDSAAAGALWEASLALSRLVGDVVVIARVVMNLGLLHYDLGNDARAVEALIESLALQRQQENLPGVADNLLNLGMVYTRQRRYAEAEAAFIEACAIWQGAGDQAGMGNTYLYMAHLAREQQQLERAMQMYEASLLTLLALGDRTRIPTALEGMAHVLLHRWVAGMRDGTSLEQSAHLFACAAALRESIGVPVHVAEQHMYQADLRRLQTLLGPPAFEAAWSDGWDMPVLSLVHAG